MVPLPRRRGTPPRAASRAETYSIPCSALSQAHAIQILAAGHLALPRAAALHVDPAVPLQQERFPIFLLEQELPEETGHRLLRTTAHLNDATASA